MPALALALPGMVKLQEVISWTNQIQPQAAI